MAELRAVMAELVQKTELVKWNKELSIANELKKQAVELTKQSVLAKVAACNQVLQLAARQLPPAQVALAVDVYLAVNREIARKPVQIKENKW
jgi:hypothetical protein